MKTNSRKSNKKEDFDYNSEKNRGNNHNKDNFYKKNQHQTIQQKQNEAIANFQKTNNPNKNNYASNPSTIDLKTFILLKNQENIELYNNEIKYLSIKKLNINSEAFVPKFKQQTQVVNEK